MMLRGGHLRKNCCKVYGQHHRFVKWKLVRFNRGFSFLFLFRRGGWVVIASDACMII